MALPLEVRGEERDQAGPFPAVNSFIQKAVNSFGPVGEPPGSFQVLNTFLGKKMSAGGCSSRGVKMNRRVCFNSFASDDRLLVDAAKLLKEMILNFILKKIVF